MGKASLQLNCFNDKMPNFEGAMSNKFLYVILFGMLAVPVESEVLGYAPYLSSEKGQEARIVDAPEKVQEARNVDAPRKVKKDTFFKTFAASANTDHVRYCSKKDKLVLYAYPSAFGDFALGISSVFTGLFTAGAGVLCAEGCSNNNPDHAIVGGICALLFGGLTIGMIACIISNYNMRNGFVPYLTFDVKGLRKFNDYVLDWTDVENIERETIHETQAHSTEDTFYYTNVTHYSVSYTDKWGAVLFKLNSYDNLLPVDYEKVQNLVRHCLACYGNQKFRAE
jgi:hypothetical protein